MVSLFPMEESPWHNGGSAELWSWSEFKLTPLGKPRTPISPPSYGIMYHWYSSTRVALGWNDLWKLICHLTKKPNLSPITTQAVKLLSLSVNLIQINSFPLPLQLKKITLIYFYFWLFLIRKQIISFLM